MEFEVLGPLRVAEGRRDLTPTRPKQRALLAMLLLHREEVVPGAQLIEALWGEQPPQTAPTALHGHVSKLRKLIGADRIGTRPPGYLLRVSADELDVARFESLIAQARRRDDPDERSARLREALALWHGEPLGELRYEAFAQREIARLKELRVAAIEDRVDADLALGRHGELAPELEPLLAEFPFRERLRGELMLALYRCGRQAEALHVFQNGRRVLGEELGIDPGPALQELELRILRQDSGLDLPIGDAHRSAPSASSVGVSGRGGNGGTFIGRVRELERLEEALAATASGSGATVLVAGDAGIGKSRLAYELTTRARDRGFGVLVGRCLDLIGTELPYQPFADALRSLAPDLPWGDGSAAGSQLHVFERTLELIAGEAESAPVLLVLEDLHWADPSTLDLVVFLAHNVDERRVLLLATHRADEPLSTERLRRLADGVRRSGSALLVDLAPLGRDELAALLAAHADAPPSADLTEAIIARSEGNPFFAEELLAAARDEIGEVPRSLQDLLLQRVARLDRETQGLLRLAAAAGRDVGYPLLCAAAPREERDVRESLRRALDHGVLVADQATGQFRFRHALLAEAVYAMLLPGEREDVHARLADALARGEPPADAAELAPHWAAAGRTGDAFVASVEAARQAEAMFGLAEALAHVERALALWPTVPSSRADLAEVDGAELCSWGAELANQTGAAQRALELGRRAVELVGETDPLRASLLHERHGRYLLATGSGEGALAAFQRAVELVPAQPPSAERAQALAALGQVLMLAWQHDESLVVSEQALALAREVGARGAELRALAVLGTDLAYLGRGDEGLERLWLALRLADERDDSVALERAYTLLTDALTMMGRPAEAARLAKSALEGLSGRGRENTTLAANWIEALVATGEWDAAEGASAAALRAITANYPHFLLLVRAELEVGRGAFDDARAHLEAAVATVHDDHSLATCDAWVAELALWECRWTDAENVVHGGLARTRGRDGAQIRVRLCAQGLRAEAELAVLARACHDGEAVRTWLARTQKLIGVARGAAVEASPVTPNARGWLALAEAEYERARGRAKPEVWSGAAATWEQLERPPLAAYCHWRQAEVLVAAGATPADAAVPLRKADAVAARMGARPLLREVEALAERAQLDVVPRETETHSMNAH